MKRTKIIYGNDVVVRDDRFRTGKEALDFAQDEARRMDTVVRSQSIVEAVECEVRA